MSVTEAAEAHVGSAPASAVQRLAVAWQHPVTRQISPVGLLRRGGETYRFDYIRNALSVSDFVSLPGFSDTSRAYVSNNLFPLFAQRVMDPRREDYERYVERLGLNSEATPWEQMSRSGGTRQGDLLQLFPEPQVGLDGMVSCLFLVHGLRHVIDNLVRVNSDEVRLSASDLEGALAALRPLDRLRLVREPSNSFNGQAVLTTTELNVPLGWVPNLLLADLYASTGGRPQDAQVWVEQINGADAPAHLRLLVGLRAVASPGYSPFTGPSWQLLSSLDG